jgi:hypothetical protein
MLDALEPKPITSSAKMTRTVTAALRQGRPLLTVALIGGSLLLLTAPSPGCADEGIGDPCIPEQEFNPDFLGFDAKEVNVESKSFQCRTRLCLVHHFQGRVSCPNGQNTEGEPPPGVGACTVPGTDTKIVGAKEGNDFIDPRKKSEVKAQCLDRVAPSAVYCSCRCADINGQRPGDQTFCDCPDGFQCERLVTSIGQGNEGLTGSYCIKRGSQYDPTTACTQGNCDPNDKAKPACN